MIRRRRAPPGPPERNVIQAPELIQRLTKRFGLRQAHVAPALTDTLQPVVIMEDITREKSTLFRNHQVWTGPVANAGDNLNFAISAIINPLNSGVRIGIQKIVSDSDLVSSTLTQRVSLFFSNNIPLVNGGATAYAPWIMDSAFYAPDPANLAVGVPLPEGGITEFGRARAVTNVRTLAITNFVQVAIETIRPGASRVEFNMEQRPWYLTPGFLLAVVHEENAPAFFASEVMTTWNWSEEPLGIGAYVR